jgi:hypothetical protein
VLWAVSSTTNDAKAEQAKVLGFNEFIDTCFGELVVMHSAVEIRLRRTDERVAWRYFADRCGSGRRPRLTAARAERDGSGKEDGCLPEARAFSSNCSRDLRISVT